MTPFHDTLGIGTDTRYEKSYQIKRAIKLLYRYDTNQHIKPQMSTVPSRDLFVMAPNDHDASLHPPSIANVNRDPWIRLIEFNKKYKDFYWKFFIKRDLDS